MNEGNAGAAFDPGRLQTAALARSPRGEDVRAILAAGMDAVDPYAAVRRALTVEGGMLSAGGRRYDLASYQRVIAVGAGKAASPMGLALEDALGERLNGGFLVTKDGHLPERGALRHITLREAGHPLPDERGVRAAAEMAALLRGLGANDLAVCLVSGGGSALLTSPAGEVTLDDLRALTGLLLRCGAEIGEINCLRKHLETLKGGGLARLAAPAAVLALVLSDVLGDPLDAIASGPAAPDSTTFADAWAVLERYGLVEAAPERVKVHLRRGLRGEIADTPRPGDAAFARVNTVVVGSISLAASAAAVKARGLGYDTCLVTTELQGEARCAGETLAGLARKAAAGPSREDGEAPGEPLPRPACLIAGGETTVTVRGEGRGGRNQELALGAVETLAGLEDALLVSLATDGGDGPTDAAGAVVSGETLARARALGLDPAEHLARNDAYTFFDALGDLLKTGPTRTNVNDLVVVCVG